MNDRIDASTLSMISRHYRSLGVNHRVKGLPYERCAELPFVIHALRRRFAEQLDYLDIGPGGESPLPSFLLRESDWNISCVDKFSWVRNQHAFAKKSMGGKCPGSRFHVIQKDILGAKLPNESFDVITNISVIEHLAGSLDTKAMEASARLLKPGGLYILSTLINEGFFREFFVKGDVYGDSYSREPVYYQRHYDLENLDKRLIRPSGLTEQRRIFFGDYGFQCFEKFFQKPPKVVRVLYQWARPQFARRFLSYRNYPVSREKMLMNTASGIIVVLTK